MTKTIIIGVDGATFDIINPLIDQGKLPNFKYLIDNGVHAPLRSTMPPLTPPAWSSFYTGKNPAKHGVYGFVNFNPDPETIRFNPTNYNSIDSKTIWDIFTDHGKKSCIVNFPMTFPPPAVNGYCYAGMGTPDINSDFTYPGYLKKELLEQFPDLSIGWDPAKDRQKPAPQLIRERLALENLRNEVAKYLYQKDDFDLFGVVFQITDRMGHMAWTLSQNEQQYRRLGFDRPPIQMAYEQVDGYIGELLGLIQRKSDLSDVNIYVVSDHGFGPHEKFFFVNEWLHREGYLALKKFKITKPFNNIGISFTPRKLSDIFFKIKLGVINRLIPSKITNILLTIPVVGRKRTGESVDWANTMAYADNYGIYINLQGRQKKGIIQEGKEHGDLIAEIINKLSDLKCGSEKVVENTYKYDEVYSGMHIKNCCDIVFKLNDKYVQNNSFLFKELFRDKKSGTHRLHGVFIGSGPNFKKGIRIDEQAIEDIFPTISAIHGFPISNDVDGAIMTNCLNGSVDVESSAIYIDEIQSLERNNEEEIYDDDQRHLIEARLKALGYL